MLVKSTSHYVNESIKWIKYTTFYISYIYKLIVIFKLTALSEWHNKVIEYQCFPLQKTVPRIVIFLYYIKLEYIILSSTRHIHIFKVQNSIFNNLFIWLYNFHSNFCLSHQCILWYFQAISPKTGLNFNFQSVQWLQTASI